MNILIVMKRVALPFTTRDVETRLVIYPNEGHGWHGATLDNSFEKIASFLQDNVDLKK